LSTTKNKELLPVYNKQQKIIITCLQHATKKSDNSLCVVCFRQEIISLCNVL
jgi:hypothetical protein